MQLTGMGLAFGAMVLVAAGLGVAQERTRGNPRAGDPDAIRAGASLYRERCAECHGADAKGVAGHDLTGLWAAGNDDERVFRTIRDGVPGTIMPASPAPDDELWVLVTYLRSLSSAGALEAPSGNTANGERIFWSECGSCHRANGRGGRLGPDLSRIAERQSREALTRAIRIPSAAIAAGYQPVTLITHEGQRIRGARKSEDAFSIQIMDTSERLQGYLKSTLREVTRDAESLMPAFAPERLSDADLDDLLRFMNTLRTGKGVGSIR